MLMSKKYLVSGIVVVVGLVATSLIIPFAVFEVHKKKLTEHDPIVIWGDEDFDLYNFPGQGTKEKPYRIEYYNITTERDVGIYLWNTTKYFIIQNCYVNANETGIFIDSVASGTVSIKKNTVEKNLKHGILIYGSVGPSLSGNICNNNRFGIYIHSSSGPALSDNVCNNNEYGIIILYSPGPSLSENVCSNNVAGIYILSSQGSHLTENECSNNIYGIYIESSQGSHFADNEFSNNNYGIYMESSQGSHFANNEFSYNNYGIYFESSNGSFFSYNIFTYNNFGLYLTFSSEPNSCFISYNLFKDNIGYAIYIEISNYDNIIDHNTFINNAVINNAESSSSQAYDDGINTWYDMETNEGNYWNDWSGIGVYTIDGLTGSVDPYPLENRPV